ncbi:YtxH domain-containing protein [Streptomyces sp. P38-E01]|uniref:YtxH domain-containing protein n=1 Tax=Streptomyces tardus TaxID=2780544 RepID=A0A949JB82_9ACTN|nr:YtxH domain-containing protein [Streptomyces tardus]MBU7596576.1 YtxH domain-containing protein [Streptomyces tardus]
MRHRWMFVTGLAVGYVIGTRAGRERYEQLRRSAQRFAENPAVRNTVESAAHNGREAAGKAANAVTDRVGDRLPPSVVDRVRDATGRRNSSSEADDWGTSNT